METMTEAPRDKRRQPIPTSPCESGLCTKVKITKCEDAGIMCKAYKGYMNNMSGSWDMEKVGIFKDTWCQRCKKQKHRCVESCSRMKG